MPKASRWVSLFEAFIKDLRINSKEYTNEDDRGIRLELWESQRRFLKCIGEGLDLGIRKFYALKSRQLGATTLSLAIDLFWLAMNRGLTGALVTDTEKNRDANRKIIEHYIRSFPEEYFGEDFKIVQANRQMMAFSNGSRLDFLVAGVKSKSSAWAEGQGYALAHMTELANYGNAQSVESFAESLAQQNPNRLFIAESTAKGFNHWRDMWVEAKEDIYTKRTVFLGWWAGDTNIIKHADPRWLQYGTYNAVPDENERIANVAKLYGHKITPEQLAWIRWKVATGGETEMLRQNQPWTEDEAFVLSGWSFFQVRQIANDIKHILENTVEYEFQGYRYDLTHNFLDMRLNHLDPDADSIDDMELAVWAEPVEGGKYVIGCDPAWGRNDHKDRSAISVWRCFADRMVQVAEFATSQVEPKHVAWVLAHLAAVYRDCIVNIELQGPGRSLMQEWDHLRGLLASDLYADRIRSHDWQDALGQARWYLYHRPDSLGAGYAANFETTWRNKTEIMHQMKGAYVTRELDIRSLELLQEMRNVIQDGAEIGAPESNSDSCKDDRVFATALAIRAWINWVRPEMLSFGLTHDKVMDTERGDIRPLHNRMNELVKYTVQNFFVTAEERATQTGQPPQWMRDRGLR